MDGEIEMDEYGETYNPNFQNTTQNINTQQTQTGNFALLGMNPFGMNAPVAKDPRRFNFEGTSTAFLTQIQGMSYQELSDIQEAHINITGQQISPASPCFACCVFLWASILIFPLLILLLNCFWKNSSAAFQVDFGVYDAIEKIGAGGLRNLILIVNDSNLGRQKTQKLYQILSRQTKLVGFTFLNITVGYDYKESQYSNFSKNMFPITQLPLISSIRWNNVILRGN